MSEKGSFDEISYLKEEVRRLRESLNLLTPKLDILLRRRGFRIYGIGHSEDLLLPESRFVNEYYAMLHRYSFRLFLRDVIKHQESFTLEKVTRYATAEVTEGYVGYIEKTGLVRGGNGEYSLKRPVRSFGETLEWYVSEIFRREFGAESIWGVKFKRPGIGGDYDVIAKLDGSLLYAEVKSSPPKQIYDSEIAAFLARVSDLSPEISVFLMDTELRMKDKIVPMFEAELRRRSSSPPEVVRMEKELFQISGRIFIVNAKETIVGNIERVLAGYFRR